MRLTSVCDRGGVNGHDKGQGDQDLRNELHVGREGVVERRSEWMRSMLSRDSDKGIYTAVSEGTSENGVEYSGRPCRELCNRCRIVMRSVTIAH